MHAGYASRLTLRDIAAAAHLTPSAASRLFPAITATGWSVSRSSWQAALTRTLTRTT